MTDGATSLHPLATALATALDQDRGLSSLGGEEPRDWWDLLLTLLAVHDLHTAPIGRLNGWERFQHHPAVAELKGRLEAGFLAELDRRDEAAEWDLPPDPAAAMRAIGAKGLVPAVYRWLAEEASLPEVTAFLALEGGPDNGFDDLVAACQIGLDGSAKLELARNYWDEMGNGNGERVHTELHRKLSRALKLEAPPRSEQPVEALERSALTGLLATNRRLQPELLGALGLLELQAGPRCRQVVKALARIGAGEDALDFYVEHSVADPRHGRDWVEKAVEPLGTDPRWAEGMVRGARLRSLVNASFFAALHRRFAQGGRRAS